MPYFPEGPPLPPVAEAADINAFVAEYRATLPIIGKYIYLNHASVGPLSDWVVAAASEMNIQQQMGETISQHAWFDGWRYTRQRVGELMGASKEEICLQTSTYLGCLRSFNALPIEAGDEVVYAADEFPSLYHALADLKLRGARLVEATSARGDGIVRSDDILNAITPKTKVVAHSWIVFAHGYRHDIEHIGRECRSRGIWYILDVIQGLGGVHLDAKASGAHFIAGQGAKWMCAPLGSGLLYVSEEVPYEITPRQEGWFAMELNHDNYMDRTVKPKRNANRFACGTVDLPSAYGLRRASEVLLEAGTKRAEDRAVGFADRLEQAAVDAGIPLYSDRSGLKSPIVSLDIANHQALPGELDKIRVAYSIRQGKLRLSPHWYMVDEEINKVCDVIRSAK